LVEMIQLTDSPFIKIYWIFRPLCSLSLKSCWGFRFVMVTVLTFEGHQLVWRKEFW
jgi:hypothetical protein